MAEYQLYCFAQSGNCYRAALMLKAIGGGLGAGVRRFLQSWCSAHTGIP